MGQEWAESVSYVHWGSARLSLRPRQLVCPSFWSLFLRLYPLLCPPFPLGSTSCVFQPDLLAG